MCGLCKSILMPSLGKAKGLGTEMHKKEALNGASYSLLSLALHVFLRAGFLFIFASRHQCFWFPEPLTHEISGWK